MALKCGRQVGCHDCLLNHVEDELMLIYAALKQFIAEPAVFRQKAIDEAVSLKRRISELIITNYKEENGGKLSGDC